MLCVSDRANIRAASAWRAASREREARARHSPDHGKLLLEIGIITVEALRAHDDGGASARAGSREAKPVAR